MKKEKRGSDDKKSVLDDVGGEVDAPVRPLVGRETADGAPAGTGRPAASEEGASHSPENGILEMSHL